MIYIMYSNPSGPDSQPVIVQTIRSGFVSMQYIPPGMTIVHRAEIEDIITIRKYEKDERPAGSLSES